MVHEQLSVFFFSFFFYIFALDFIVLCYSGSPRKPWHFCWRIDALYAVSTESCMCNAQKKGIYREIYSSLSWNSSIADIHCYIMAYRNVVFSRATFKTKNNNDPCFLFSFSFFLPLYSNRMWPYSHEVKSELLFRSCPLPCGNVSTIQDHWGHNSNFGPCEKEVKYEGTRPRCMYWNPSSCPTLVEDTGFYENEASLCQNLGP